MGSDSSPQTLFDGVLKATSHIDSCTLVVIATDSIIPTLQAFVSSQPNIQFIAVKDTIAMGDEPLSAISLKKSSSLVVGMKMLKKGQLDAFISAGNTGALIASAALHLPKLPGIKRPALLADLPTVEGSVAVLDVGGNVSCKSQHLVQYAHMGAAYQICSKGIKNPKVGLLNIGVEPKKGTSAVREAYQWLESEIQSKANFHFIGNVEGRDVFQGKVDVLVTDGFTGNILLKTSEGVATFIFEYIKETLSDSVPETVKHTLANLKRYFSYRERPGAFICGIEGIVIKCHGNASSKEMFNSIINAHHLAKSNLTSLMRKYLEG